jgi:hypothetical protein
VVVLLATHPHEPCRSRMSSQYGRHSFHSETGEIHLSDTSLRRGPPPDMTWLAFHCGSAPFWSGSP